MKRKAKKVKRAAAMQPAAKKKKAKKKDKPKGKKAKRRTRDDTKVLETLGEQTNQAAVEVALLGCFLRIEDAFTNIGARVVAAIDELRDAVDNAVDGLRADFEVADEEDLATPVDDGIPAAVTDELNA